MGTIPWWYTEFGEAEKAELLSAFDDKHLTLGSRGAEFEKQFSRMLEVPYAVVTNSGTAALTMALLAVGVEPGDEVIVPDLTWIATVQAAAILGARAILVDCLPELPLMDPVDVKRKITPRTKAIIPVHYNGRPCQMDELLEIAHDAGIALIEDACKALASKTSKGYLGTLGTLGCYSLGMVSLVSTCYGGVVVTREEKLYQKLKLIRDHGVRRGKDEKYEAMGFNFKFSDILASIGVAQLSRLGEKVKHVHKIYQRYVDGLSSLRYVEVIPVDIESGQVSLLIDVRSKHVDEIIDYLNQHGVETVRFHPPLHLASYLNNSGDFPNASRFADEGFNLPCGPSQPLENVERCIELLQEWNMPD